MWVNFWNIRLAFLKMQRWISTFLAELLCLKLSVHFRMCQPLKVHQTTFNRLKSDVDNIIHYMQGLQRVIQCKARFLSPDKRLFLRPAAPFQKEYTTGPAHTGTHIFGHVMKLHCVFAYLCCHQWNTCPQ